MDEWTCVAGSTLIIPSGPSGEHLFVILNEPKDISGHINSSVLVNVSSIRKAPYDDTCILEPGSHAFIKQRSYIAYRHARIDREDSLIQKVNTSLFRPHDPLDDELLKRIQIGLYKSPQTRRFLKETDL